MADTVPQPLVSDLQPTARLRAVPVLLTLIAIGIAGWASWAAWQAYMGLPWTRDGVVLAYAVTVAPQVSGQITHLNVSDNQYVHKGDILMTIDPTDWAVSVERAQARADQARLDADNAGREAARRQALGELSVSEEERQTYVSRAESTAASYRDAKAALVQAQTNLQRTDILSPVNGYVTNLLTQPGDYASVGKDVVTLVDGDSFWVAGYFEETALPKISAGAPASIKLMGSSDIIPGHVDSFARGIAVARMQPDAAGLPPVNPIFAWVRLAQRVPVRIHLDQIPKDTKLFIGETATVEVHQPGQ
jgi:multidrug resistance efflux pump